MPGCPTENSFEWSLKQFLVINLGEAEDQRFQRVRFKGQVLKSPEANLRFIKNCFRQIKRDSDNKRQGLSPFYVYLLYFCLR